MDYADWKRFAASDHFYLEAPNTTSTNKGSITRMRKLRRKTKQNSTAKAAEYATRSDFQQIFSEDMAGLHLLAFLLTADAEKAERCFVAGLEDSTRDNAVFRQWARAWSKRSIIKNAIKAVSPAPGRSERRGTGDAQAAP